MESSGEDLRKDHSIQRKKQVLLPGKNMLVVSAEKPKGQWSEDSEQGKEGVRRGAKSSQNDRTFLALL